MASVMMSELLLPPSPRSVLSGQQPPKKGGEPPSHQGHQGRLPGCRGDGGALGSTQFPIPHPAASTAHDARRARHARLTPAWAKTNRPMTFLSVPVHFPNEPPLRAQKAHATKEDIQIHINHSYDSSLYIKGASVPCPSYEILTFVLKKNYLREN